ncbi:MAG: hypothetical protein FWG67_05325 [Defluviitaleaceae bacterium]|nr:hypothetical protein [Defluviitaleaceae bacterium]
MKIDFSFYIAFLLALFSHQIDVYLTYLIAILIHECGHLVMASFFKWELEELKVSAVGGFLTFKNDLSKPVYQSLLVASGGVLFNLIFGFILWGLDGPASLIYSQFAIAIFNLLPIWPLDGSKVMQAGLRGLFPYETVLEITKFTNIIFLLMFVLSIVALRWEQYFLVAIILAILVGKFQATAPYIYERYKIQKTSN